MINELWEKQKPLMMTGVVSFICFLILAVVMMFDSTQILGINRWIKPIKFYTSIAIFVWTIAVFLNFLKGYEKASRRISWAMIVIFIVEMLIITGQAARGTTSHFNVVNPFDGMLYGIMGLAIVANTFLVGYLTYLYFKAKIELPKTILWGIRLGLIIFLLGSIEGGYMSSQTGHAVGVADGGKGLPLVNWSTEGGDLRVAHFFGLHAIQAIPVFAYLLEKLKLNISTALTFIFSIIYFAIFTFLFVQALNGQPFLSKLF
ncbi:MAG: hypothetical protein K1X72_27725 [Pyrinomonadaceae bacterium]|nr:hypothetical protein [Pyrinomonadaceae bacterium]